MSDKQADLERRIRAIERDEVGIKFLTLFFLSLIAVTGSVLTWMLIISSSFPAEIKLGALALTAIVFASAWIYYCWKVFRE